MVETTFYFVAVSGETRTVKFAYSNEQVNRSQFEQFLKRNGYREATEKEIKSYGTSR